MIIDFKFLILVLGTLHVSVNCGLIPARKQDQIVKYLIEYGYLPTTDPSVGNSRSEKQLKEALKLFQRVSGIPETGKTDRRTWHMVRRTRCGVSDFIPSAIQPRRRKRYVLQGTKWNKKDLTFKIMNYTPDLSKKETHDTIVAAFNVWSKVVPLTFTETDNDDADIRIRFVSGSHDDGYPFDGKGGTLAHAFYPHHNKGLSGDAHFDEHETFTLRTHSGVNLFVVAVHEFGHSLGLGHSFTREAIMYPFYRGYLPDLKLHNDDIKGMQAIYGKPVVKPTTVQPKITPPLSTQTPRPRNQVPKTCDTSVDVMVYGGDGITYAFKGDYFWPISDQGEWTGELKISTFWSGLAGNLDAGFTRSDKTTLFFKGSSYWVFKQRSYILGPREITSKELNLPKELAGMDAAFVWGPNGHTYYFKGDKYWRYNDEEKRIEDGYPKSIREAWSGLPDNLDAALQWKNGKSYFFKGLDYYLLDDLLFQVNSNYPKKISREWMGCSLKGNIDP